MTEEIMDVKGNLFKLTYDNQYVLTNENREYVKTVIMKETCSSCGQSGNIKVLGTCSRSSVIQGGTIDLSVPSITGGTSPFDITFYKMAPGSSTKQTLFTDLSVSTFPLTHLAVPVPTSDAIGDWTYGIDLVDHCTGTPKGSCSQSCTITVQTPVAKSITVTSPTAGVAWAVNSTHNVTWTYTGSITSVNIHLYRGGIDVGTGCANCSGNSWAWTISPRPYANDYRIRITDNADSTIYGESPNFTITNLSSITVNCPVSGCSVVSAETLQMSTVCTDVSGATFTCPTLQWNSSDTTKATVNSTTGLVTGVAAGTTRITATDMVTGISGFKDITVTVAKSIAITSPNGGESWTQGTTNNITWSYTGSISTIRLDLYKGTLFDSAIATGVSASSLTRSWTVPNTQAAGTDYRVRIVDEADANTNDLSNNYFTIVQAIAIGSVSPTIWSMYSGGQKSFVALDTLGNPISSGVTWSVTGGTISTAGLYTAPTVTSSTNYTITATYNSVQRTATVTVNPIAVTICTWIDNQGGPTAFPGQSIKILTLIQGYLGMTNLGFTVTAGYILGCIWYYLGNVSTGNTFTGYPNC